MTVREALNTLELTEHQLSAEALESALRRKLQLEPAENATWQRAYQRLVVFLDPAKEAALASMIGSAGEPEPSDWSRANRTQEILVFTPERDVMFAEGGTSDSLSNSASLDLAPSKPAPSEAPTFAPSVGRNAARADSHEFLPDHVVLFDEPLPPPELNAPRVTATAPNTADTSPNWQTAPETSVSGEWELMLESLEADGLIVSESGTHMIDPLLTRSVPEAVPPAAPLAQNLNTPSLDTPLFAALEPEPELPAAPVASRESAHALNTVLSGDARLLNDQPNSPGFVAEPLLSNAPALGAPVFSPPVPPAPDLVRSTTHTWDESLLLTTEEPVVMNLPPSSAEALPSEPTLSDSAPSNPAPSDPAPSAPIPPPAGLKPPAHPTLALEAGGAAAVPPLSPRPAPLPGAVSEPLGREAAAKARVSGRPSEAPPFERRTSYPSRTGAAAPRSYRDIRERDTKEIRRRQPVWLWLIGLAALAASGVVLTPNLLGRLQTAFTPGNAVARAAPPVATQAAPVKAPPAVSSRAPQPLKKPQAVVKATPKPAPQPVSAAKPAPAKPKPAPAATSKPAASSAVVASAAPDTVASVAPKLQPVAAPTSPPPAPQAAVTPPQSRVVKPQPKPVSVKKPAPAPRTGASALPPVTLPEVRVVSPPPAAPAKPTPTTAAKPSKPAVKPAVKKPTAPVPQPVASIEYQEPKPASETQVLPGGLSRAEFGRQFLNRKQFEVWQSQGAELNYASWDEVPLETQILPSAAFKAAVLISLQPASPERP